MSRMLLPLSVSAALASGTAMADVPIVAADIAPVHSLVARVMEGVGEPALVVPAGASPHEHSLRPSEASALQEAELVFWMGEELTPWMHDALETLAPRAAITTLLESEKTTLLAFREDALFEAHDHGDHEEHGDDSHDHDDHHDAKNEEHDDHGDEDHAGHDHHDHGDHDPHAWLSPSNASAWLNVIAAQLSAADPDNASTYFANAATAQAEIATLTSEVNATLEPVRGGKFIVFHDAYQYFETEFGLQASGAISLGDASDPSPARISEIQGRVADENISCVLSEPQFNSGIVATVMDGTEANTSVIDPLGSTLKPGSSLYPQLIRDMAKTFAECL